MSESSSKLFILAIGGTGVRVLRSLMMLLASGAKLPNTSEVIPIVIDSDLANGNWISTKLVMDKYKKIRDEIKDIDESNFFHTKISGLNDILQTQSDKTKEYFKIQLENTENTEFQKFIDYSNLDDNNKALIDLLFSKDNLEINMSEGFYGNPNVGSVVFTQLQQSKEFQLFLDRFSKGDRVFFISSLFGGTGAAGFPTIVHLIQNAKNEYVKNTKIGSICLQPYFGLTQEDTSKINSEVFLAKTKAAMDYIQNLDVHARYFLGDEDSRSSSKYDNNPGSAGQNNKAHYIELCSALSVFDFMEKSDSELNTPSNYYYGIYETDKSKPYSLKNFSEKSYKYLKNLINYSFFVIYLNNKKNDFLSRLTTWNQNSDKGGMLNKDFFNSSFYSNLESFNSEFLLWLCELSLNNQSFSILNKCFDDPKLFSSDREETTSKLRKRLKEFVTEKNILELPGLELKTRNIGQKLKHLIDSDPYDKLTKELNSAVTSKIKNIQSITSLPQKFICLFGLSIDTWINQYFLEFDSSREKSSKPKILNYHNPSYKTDHWYNINQKVDTGIILDPDQTKINKEITSIPSPFARIKLCESSFSYVKNSPEGETPYHKLVSDCLDVWITVFYQNRFQDEISIKEWYRGDNNNPGDLGKLLSSKNLSHRLLGENLKLFLDRENYFKDWNQFFIIFDGRRVIGGTSPLTVFFPTANREGIGRTFGHDTTFDSSYCSLNNREKDFKEYIYRFRDYLKENSINTENVSKLNDYIDKNSSEVLHEDSTGNKYYNNPKYYEPIKLSGGKTVKLHNITEVRKKYIDNSLQSDFFIQPSFEKVRKVLPLVLGEFYPSQDMHYINASWNHPTIPYYDEKPLEDRRLPGEGMKYPYLTISDFLEPYLIELDFPINDTYYFNPLKDTQSKNNGYLLPLKPIFFEYFTSNNLAKGSLKKDSSKFIEIHKLAGDGVEVTLRIPIQKNEYIEFKRIYFDGETTQPSEKDNRGKLIKSKFSINLSPPLKSCPNPNYRIMLINVESNDRKKYSLSFINNNEELKESSNNIHSSLRSEDPGNFVTEYYSLKSEFDYIKVIKEYPDCTGIIIPIFQEYKNLDKSFKFSIDFGTSNTHIEVKEGDNEEIPFAITKKDIQIATLHKDDNDLSNKEIIDFINIEFFPKFIDNAEKYHFPTRTVLGEKANINFFDKNLKGLVVSNIPFGYGKERMIDKHINIQSNLKWVSNDDDQEKSKFNKRIELFFEELLFLIRNKILLNGGNLEKTKIIWFYPYSMDSYTRENTFSTTWNEMYKEYINPEDITHYFSESIAPYYYYLNKYGSQGSVVVSVDIGGGTTDLAFYLDRKPLFLSSARFASNNLFGSGFGNTYGEENGFIQKNKEKIFKILDDPKLKDLRAELELSLKRTSYESISTLFSMENAKEIKESSLKFSFSEMLQEDSKFRLVFLFYYTSILYHIVKILKMKNIDPPKNIIFTGMGSKVLNLIVRNDKTLEEYTKYFIEEFLKKSYGERRFEILINKINPKEATCKGGLYMISEDIPSDIDDFKFVLLGSSRDEFISDKDNPKKYSNISNQERNEIANEIIYFIDLFFDFGSKYFEKKFGITNHDFINKSKKLLLNRDEILKYITNGEDKIKKEIRDSNNKTIVESYFFYPITGLLNLLVKNIANGELK